MGKLPKYKGEYQGVCVEIDYTKAEKFFRDNYATTGKHFGMLTFEKKPMNAIEKIIVQVEILHSLGMKPSLVVCDTKVMLAVKNFTRVNINPSVGKSSVAFVTVNGYDLDLVEVSGENICEVYSKEKI